MPAGSLGRRGVGEQVTLGQPDAPDVEGDGRLDRRRTADELRGPTADVDDEAGAGDTGSRPDIAGGPVEGQPRLVGAGDDPRARSRNRGRRPRLRRRSHRHSRHRARRRSPRTGRPRRPARGSGRHTPGPRRGRRRSGRGTRRPVRSTPAPSRTTRNSRTTSRTVRVAGSMSAMSRRIELVPQSTAPTRTSGPFGGSRIRAGQPRPPWVEPARVSSPTGLTPGPAARAWAARAWRHLNAVRHTTGGDAVDLGNRFQARGGREIAAGAQIGAVRALVCRGPPPVLAEPVVELPHDACPILGRSPPRRAGGRSDRRSSGRGCRPAAAEGSQRHRVPRRGSGGRRRRCPGVHGRVAPSPGRCRRGQSLGHRPEASWGLSASLADSQIWPYHG